MLITYCFTVVFPHCYRSVQLKSLITTFTERGKIPVLEFLSAALESAEYERALTRGLVWFLKSRIVSFVQRLSCV